MSPSIFSSADSPGSAFTKFLDRLNENGEIVFDLRQVKMLLQSDAYQFLNKKLENKKIGFLNFFDTHRRTLTQRSCRSLKSLCRYAIKMHVKRYPQDIEQFSLNPSITDRLLTFLTYENKYAFESYVWCSMVSFSFLFLLFLRCSMFLLFIRRVNGFPFSLSLSHSLRWQSSCACNQKRMKEM